MANNCKCILCYLGRNVIWNNDIADFKEFSEVILKYNKDDSPYPITKEDIDGMLEMVSDKETVFFEDFVWKLQEWFDRKRENAERKI